MSLRTLFRNRLVLALFAGLLLPAGAARAQHEDQAGEMRKKMAEISQLMRDSERLLLEMTKIDRLVEQQRRVVDELEKLEPPEQPANAASKQGGEPQDEERERKRAQLQQQQQELQRKLAELFQSQDSAAQQSVAALEKLLRELPKGGSGGGSPQPEQNQQQTPPEDGEKPEEKKQGDADRKGQKDQQKPREDKTSSLDEKKSKEEREREARLARHEAWIARLPPEQQERISRGDFSGFPARYRRLLREYTRLRAEREAKERENR